MLDSYDFDTELETNLDRNLFEDESEIPDAPESWSLDDFGDLMIDSDEFGF